MFKVVVCFHLFKHRLKIFAGDVKISFGRLIEFCGVKTRSQEVVIKVRRKLIPPSSSHSRGSSSSGRHHLALTGK